MRAPRGPRRFRRLRHARTLAAALAALLVVALPSAAGLGAAAATTATPAPAGAAPTGGAPSGSPAQTTFTIGITQDVDSLNPFTGITASVYEVWQLNYDYLTQYSAKDFSAAPSLAETWTTSPDGLVWTFTLRQGATFSDGVPVTSKDVKYTIDRVIDGTYEQTNYGNYVANIAKVETPDERTVVITAKKPTPVLLHMAVPILPEHIWKDISEDEVADFSNDPGPNGIVGSGPFSVTEYRKGQFLRLERNSGWWGEKPAIDEVVFRIFSNDDSMAQALKRGEIDFLNDINANVFRSLSNTTGIEATAGTYSGFNEIAMNTGAALQDGTPIGDGHPALEDVEVRQAIAHAIDRETLVKRVFGDFGSAGSTVIPPIYANLHYDPGDEAFPFDPAEANRRLDAAGYARGSDGVRRMPDGSRPLVFRLFGRTSSQESRQTVEFAKGWLADIGITANVKIVSEDNLTEIIGQGEFDLFEWGWVVEPDPDYQLSTFTCGHRSYKEGDAIYADLSDSFYCDEEYDALYEEQALQIEPSKRAETVKAMQKMLYEASPYVITAYYDNLEAHRSDRFTDFTQQPQGEGGLLFQYGIWSYLSMRPVTNADGGTGGGGGDGGGAPVVLIGGAVVVVAALALVGVVLARRRRPADDVE